jgi:hypothetical protein
VRRREKEKRILKSLRLARRFLFVLIAVSIVASSFLLSTVQADSEYSAFVWTDREEYYPSETVYVFGYGFDPYAQVTVTIQRPDLSQDVISTSTDEFGYFVSQYQLDGIHGTYNVTATDGINKAETTFRNCLHFKVKWRSSCCWYIWVHASHLDRSKTYYVKYFDPAGIERRTSPTYTGVRWFKDNFTILPSLPNILGTWTVNLYEDATLRRTKTVEVDKMVWTTDSTYTTLITSFAQGETMYFKAIGLITTKYYRFRLDRPDETKIYVGDWTTGVTNLTGSYVLPSDAEIGSWKLHVREASDSFGTDEHHYVDTCYFEVSTAPPPPPQYYLTVQVDPAGITTIPGEGWYTNCTYVNLTAPELVPGPSDGIQYRFHYWDVDGESQGVGNSTIQVHMNMNHTATAHFITQYYLNMTSSPPGVTIPAGAGWYDAGTNASIFAPEFVGITPGASRYRFDGWTTADMNEIANASSTSTTVLMDKPKTVTANYVVQYNVTFSQSGVGTDFPGTIVIIDGTEYGLGDPVSFWWDEGSVHNFAFQSPLLVTPNAKQYVWNSTDGLSTLQSGSITVTTSGNVIGYYKTQYYLTVISPYGTPSGSGWYYNSSTAYARLDVGMVDHGNGTRRVFVQWSGDASGTNYAASDPITMDAPKTALAEWKTQYYVTVISPYGIPGGEGWYDNSSIIYVWLDTGVIDHGNGTRRVFSHWSGDGSGTDYSQSDPIHVDSPKTIIAVWKTQFYLTVTSPYATPGGQGWYDENSVAYATLDTDTVDHGNGTRRVFTNWTGDASGTNYAQSDPILMDGPKTAIAQWKTQYQLTMSTNHGTTSPSVGQHWYDEGSVVSISATAPSAIDGERYVWLGWNGTGTISYTGMDNPASVTMNSPITQTATWGHEYRLTMATNYGTTTPPVGDHWYEAGSIVEISATPPSVIEGERYLWNGWIGTGNGSYSTLDNPAFITMNGPITQTASWTHQFLLTIKTSGIPSAYPTKVYLDGLQVGTASDALQYTKWFDSGTSTGTIGVDDMVSGATGTRYVFVKWVEDSSTSNPRAAEIMNSPKTFTALYKTQYYLTVNTYPAGLSPAPAPPSDWYDNSTDVTLTAPSESYLGSDKYDFTHWEVDGIEVPGNPITVHMNQPHTATAHYSRPVAPVVTVGGRSILLTEQAPTSHTAAYATLIALFGAALSLKKRKRK